LSGIKKEKKRKIWCHEGCTNSIKWGTDIIQNEGREWLLGLVIRKSSTTSRSSVMQRAGTSLLEWVRDGMKAALGTTSWREIEGDAKQYLRWGNLSSFANWGREPKSRNKGITEEDKEKGVF
jgi:hypothetical protein